VVNINITGGQYMPIYIYLCPSCGKRTEKITTSDRKMVWCSCGKIAKRIFCAEGTTFKINGYNEKNGYS